MNAWDRWMLEKTQTGIEPQWDPEFENYMQQHGYNKSNQMEMKELGGGPVKRQNKAMKNQVIQNNYPKYPAEITAETLRFPPQYNTEAAHLHNARLDNTYKQASINPNSFVGDTIKPTWNQYRPEMDVNAPNSQTPRLTPKDSSASWYKGNVINRLAGPVGKLPAALGAIGVLDTANQIQEQMNQAGGWMNWLRGRQMPEL